MTPRGKPVIAEPGLTPTFPPLMRVGPVLVTFEPARTAKFPAVPRSMKTALACGGITASAVIASRIRVFHLIPELLALKTPCGSPRHGRCRGLAHGNKSQQPRHGPLGDPNLTRRGPSAQIKVNNLGAETGVEAAGEHVGPSHKIEPIRGDSGAER